MSKVKLVVKIIWHDDNGQAFIDFRPATADEIKAGHPKCGTCRHSDMSIDYGFELFCNKDKRFIRYADSDYCRHHTPKEAT